MAYQKTIWENDKTPLNAENLNKIEDGIEASFAAGQAAADTAKEEAIADADAKLAKKANLHQIEIPIAPEDITQGYDIVPYFTFTAPEDANGFEIIEMDGVWGATVTIRHNATAQVFVFNNSSSNDSNSNVHYFTSDIKKGDAIKIEFNSVEATNYTVVFYIDTEQVYNRLGEVEKVANEANEGLNGKARCHYIDINANEEEGTLWFTLDFDIDHMNIVNNGSEVFYFYIAVDDAPFDGKYDAFIVNAGETLRVNYDFKKGSEILLVPRDLIQTSPDIKIQFEFHVEQAYNLAGNAKEIAEEANAKAKEADAEAKANTKNKANLYDTTLTYPIFLNDSVTFELTEAAVEEGFTISQVEGGYQSIANLVVDGVSASESAISIPSGGVVFNGKDDTALEGVWKAGASCTIVLDSANDPSGEADVTVSVPIKIDVQACYEKAKTAETLQKKIDLLGIGESRIEVNCNSEEYESGYYSPYGANSAVILNNLQEVPTTIEINGHTFNIRADYESIVAGCALRYIDLKQNILAYKDGGYELTLDNLYEGDYSLKYAFNDPYSNGELRISFADNAFEVDNPFTICFRIDPSNKNDNADIDETGRLVTHGDLNTFRNELEWKLLAEVEVTEATTDILVDFGAPITDWYAETLIHLQAPKNADNTTSLKPYLRFGTDETNVNASTDYPPAIYLCQSANVGALSHSYKINAMFHTAWLNKTYALFTEIKNTAVGAVSYPQHTYGTANMDDEHLWKIQGKQVLLLKDYKNEFTFPAGTVVKVYGRG